MPCDWHVSVSEQRSLLRRWQRLMDRRGPLACICASCIQLHSPLSDQTAVAGQEDEDADVVGGLPHLPYRATHEHSPAILAWPACPLCSSPMLFLLKLHTAAVGQVERRQDDEDEERQESRTLLFFCCGDEQCDSAHQQPQQRAESDTQQQARSRWRVWRLTATSRQPVSGGQQQQRIGGAHTDDDDSSSQRQQASESEAASEWGPSGEWECETDEIDHSRIAAADEGELSARVEELILHRQQVAHSAHPPLTQQRRQVRDAASARTRGIGTETRSAAATLSEAVSSSTSGSIVSGSSNVAASPSLPLPSPSFRLHCVRPFFVHWSAAAGWSSASPADSAEELVVQRLLRQYRQQCGAEEQAEHTTPRPTVADSYDDLGDDYERTATSTFARFLRQLRRQPQQRIRYQTNHTERVLPKHDERSDSRDEAASSSSDSDSDSDSDSGELDGGVQGGSRSRAWRDECLPADSRMRRAMWRVSRTRCCGCGTLRVFECQLLGSLVSDLVDVSTGQSVPLGWTTAALYTCRNAQCRVGEMFDETDGLLLAS